MNGELKIKGGEFMGKKKEITVEVVGTVPKSIICDFYNTLFRTIDEKYGRDFLLAVKEELDKQ